MSKIIFLYICLCILITIITSSVIRINNFESNGSGSGGSGNGGYNYITTTQTDILLSKVCPSTDSVDFYRVGKCIDGYEFQCSNDGQSVMVLSYDDFSCTTINVTNTYPIGCNTFGNTTTYYNCVTDIDPITSSYVMSTYGSHGCSQDDIIHQKYIKLDICSSQMNPILYGSCNQTYFSYSYFNNTNCQNPTYQVYDPINICTNSDLFGQSFSSTCI